MMWKYLRLSKGFVYGRGVDEWVESQAPFYARKGQHLRVEPDPFGHCVYVWLSLTQRYFTEPTSRDNSRGTDAAPLMPVVTYLERREPGSLWNGEGSPPPDGHSTGALKRVPKTHRQARAGE